MTAALAQALDRRVDPVEIFFRDDDAGWAMPELGAMLDLFADHDCPVDLAVIPAALDGAGAAMLHQRREAHPRLGFHQHGYAHRNHEPAPARKCEFGPSRPRDRQCADILIGRDRLAHWLGPTDPIFTPPWNRCSPDLPQGLADFGFALLSDDGAYAGDALPLLPITLDWDRARRRGVLEAELADAVATTTAPVGIMLHHATLDPEARATLARTLGLLGRHPRVVLRSMRHWLGEAR